MNLKELEDYLKEMRDAGATDETEICFVYNYEGINIMKFSDINLYFPEISPNFIEIDFN